MKILLIGAGLAVSASAMAFSGVGPFAGALNDSFETYADYNSGALGSLGVMGGAATFTGNPSGYPGLWVISPGATWGLGGNGAGHGNTGSQALGFYEGGSGPNITLTFATAVTDFGGYWQTADSSYGTVNVSFYDAGGSLLGSDSFVNPNNDYVWHGWSDAAGIKTMVLSGNVAPVVDDIQANATPEPASMAALALGAAGLLRRRSRKA